jgi:hypothetical protein
MSSNMTNPLTTIFDQTTGKEITREMTSAEFTQWQLDQQADADFNTAQEAKADAKAALLDRLGITADEAALLLG